MLHDTWIWVNQEHATGQRKLSELKWATSVGRRRAHTCQGSFCSCAYFCQLRVFKICRHLPSREKFSHFPLGPDPFSKMLILMSSALHLHRNLNLIENMGTIPSCRIPLSQWFSGFMAPFPAHSKGTCAGGEETVEPGAVPAGAGRPHDSDLCSSWDVKFSFG